jgi:hypothetical protein
MSEETCVLGSPPDKGFHWWFEQALGDALVPCSVSKREIRVGELSCLAPDSGLSLFLGAGISSIMTPLAALG